MKTRIMLSILAVLLLTFQAAAQEASHGRKRIAGKVSTSLGEPVKGAMLFVDGELTGKRTNKKGIYRIKIGKDTETFSVYSESYGSEEALYLGQDTLNFVLNGSFNARVIIPPEEEEYVDIGYGKVRRNELTQPVGSVSKNKINQAHYTDIYSMIQGEVPGVTVTGDRIIIRGLHTINASNEPLYVVDGVIVRTISHINPVDVESIDILKGPSASIYGVNGANGVILISTKKARRK